MLHGLRYEWRLERTGLFVENSSTDAAEYLSSSSSFWRASFVLSSRSAALRFQTALSRLISKMPLKRPTRLPCKRNRVWSFFELLLEWMQAYVRSMASTDRLDLCRRSGALLWRGTEPARLAAMPHWSGLSTI